MPGAVPGAVYVLACLSNPYSTARGRYCSHPHFISGRPEARWPKVTQLVGSRAGIRSWAQPGSVSVPFDPAPSCPQPSPVTAESFSSSVPSSCGRGFPAPPILLALGGSRMVLMSQPQCPQVGGLSGVQPRGEDLCGVHLGERPCQVLGPHSLRSFAGRWYSQPQVPPEESPGPHRF